MEQKTVFISYRRSLSKHLARSIYQDLKMNGWDVFLDVNTIDSGDFDRIILNQIGARAHFILLVSPGSLERCTHSGDWLLREIEEAVRLERNIVPIVEEEADFTHEVCYLPDDLQHVIEKKNALPLSHYYFDAGMEILRDRFLKIPEYVTIQTAPVEDAPEVQRRLAEVEAALPSSSPPPKPATRQRSVDLMPKPFAWVEIPPGKVTLTHISGYLREATTFDVAAFLMAKYPVTNAQYAEFIKAGGYENAAWWTQAGWQKREEESWQRPRYWDDDKWNGAEQPVVGVSWYEAVAFCLWLSDVTGEKIMLPTEQQWQRAAQGDDGRAYLWGNSWDSSKCQNSAGKSAGKTSPVTTYAGTGDSPFDVVDMAGNVWEWCLTDWDSGENDINSTANNRVLRGGSWEIMSIDIFRCDNRDLGYPHDGDNGRGFRVSRF